MVIRSTFGFTVTKGSLMSFGPTPKLVVQGPCPFLHPGHHRSSFCKSPTLVFKKLPRFDPHPLVKKKKKKRTCSVYVARYSLSKGSNQIFNEGHIFEQDKEGIMDDAWSWQVLGM